ncbi:toll/interleukin-1 receptor domain-containing protein [Vibrio sp. 10N.222.49.A3]|uniref:toll/interleukin-1 receptor domain-containing protein n=1 Tax=Vibrio sp. 10N.222.49.A3 TaxID=3229611 RepID=UPI00354F8F50
MSTSVPKVFLSYSHDNAEHKQWVLDLATRLVNGGIDARIDAWSLGAGDDLPHFMETQLAEVDRVIMVCTSNYVNKANKGTGGVGYEKMIVTSSLMSRIDDNKIIPIIRQQGTNDVPTFLKSKLYIDFSNDKEFEAVIDDLMRAVHGSPLYKKPELGSNPYQTAESKPAESKLINRLNY